MNLYSLLRAHINILDHNTESCGIIPRRWIEACAREYQVFDFERDAYGNAIEI